MPKQTATAELLKGDKQIILRWYAPGVAPVEPNNYDTTVTVDCFGPVGVVKATVEFEGAAQKIQIGGEQLKPFGVNLLNYRHKGRWHVIEL